MKVFLGGASSEQHRALSWAAMLDEAGAELTSRWFVGCESWTGRDHELQKQKRFDIAISQLAAVRDADVVWILVPNFVNGGSMVELGAALGMSKTVITSGPSVNRTLFTSACHFMSESDFAAFAEVRRLLTPL